MTVSLTTVETLDKVTIVDVPGIVIGTTVWVGVYIVVVTGISRVTVMSKFVEESPLVAVTLLKVASEAVVSVMVTVTCSEGMMTSVSVPGTVTVTVEPSTFTSVS